MAPISWEIAARGLVKFATRPLHLATKVLPSTVTTVVDTVRRAVGGVAMASPFTAPQTAFNATVTGHRNIAYAQLDLDDVKKVKNHFDVKVNDVVMALVSGVLRQFLLDRGELPDSSLIAMVPVSVHGRSDRPGPQQGVRDVLQPAHRDRRPRRAAGRHRGGAVRLPRNTVRRSPRRCCRTGPSSPPRRCSASRCGSMPGPGSPRPGPVHNLVVSNVPGPQVPLYFLGSQVKAMYPLGPIFHGSGLNITVMSLNGKLDVGIDLVPGVAARPVGPGRRLLGRDGGVARRHPLTRRRPRYQRFLVSVAAHGSMSCHEPASPSPIPTRHLRRGRPSWCWWPASPAAGGWSTVAR